MNKLENLLTTIKTSKSECSLYSAYKELNHEHKLSLREIASLLGTYPNKVRREFKKLGITCLDKSEIQKELLESGKVNHPTKGKNLSDEVKEKISNKIAESWKEKPKNREIVSTKAKERWGGMTKTEKREALGKASDAIRVSAKEGSKLERFIKDGLYNHGYVSIAHKVGVLRNEDLEFDLYIRELGLVIEIDGPSHFEPIWGSEVLKKNQKRDREKAGLALANGLKFLRVKQTRNYSQFYFRGLLAKVIEVVDNIKSGNTKDNYFEV
jgi:very-short-patch-repair endonuclease